MSVTTRLSNNSPTASPDDLIASLSRLHGVRVVARTSRVFFQESTSDIREIAKHLGVDLVLEGSVRRSSSRLRVTAQLINAADGCHLWSDRYDREIDMQDVLAVQDEITEAVLVAAQEHFARALNLDPNNADTYWMYAHLPSNAGRHDEALHAIAHARALDPLSGFINAIEGQFLLHAGRIDDAIVPLREAIELDPRSRAARLVAARAYIAKGMFDAARLEAREAHALTPSNTRARALEIVANARRGEHREAKAAFKTLLQLSRERYVSPYHLAIACHGLNDAAEAIAWLERGCESHDPRMVFLNVDPIWIEIRSDAHFQRLLRRMRFD